MADSPQTPSVVPFPDGSRPKLLDQVRQTISRLSTTVSVGVNAFWRSLQPAVANRTICSQPQTILHDRIPHSP